MTYLVVYLKFEINNRIKMEVDSMYDLMDEKDLQKYLELYTNNVRQFEELLNIHRRELSRIKEAIEIRDLPISITEKREKINEIWAPSPNDILPNDIETCHKVIKRLRKLNT